MIHSRDAIDPIWAIKKVALLHGPVQFVSGDGVKIHVCTECGQVAPCDTMVILNSYIDDHRGS